MREKGQATFSGSFESLFSGPIDARTLVGLKSDLIDSTTWTTPDTNTYAYIGMIVSVWNDTEENNGIYRLKALPFTAYDSWEKLGTQSKFVVPFTVDSWTLTDDYCYYIIEYPFTTSAATTVDVYETIDGVNEKVEIYVHILSDKVVVESGVLFNGNIVIY